MKYVYGPVPSWRLGRSLGVDLISGEHTCSFNCLYCQLGETKNKTKQRKVFNSTKDIIKDIEQLPEVEFDYITLSGTGEPSLGLNLGEVVQELKKRFKKPVAILTNSTLMTDPKVRRELSNCDLVIAKLDAPDESLLQAINRPVDVALSHIIDGIERFNREYPGKLALQIMFVGQNKRRAAQLAKLAKEINPVEVQINTPLRPCGSKPLSKKEIDKIKKLFDPLKVSSVYDADKVIVKALEEEQTKKRRPR